MTIRTLLLAAALGAAGTADAALPKPELEVELDAYYTAAAATFSLSSGTASGVVDDEIGTYAEMARRALLPQFLLLEASVNPLPLAGAFVRNNAGSLYHRSRVTPSLNLVEAATVGFEEPYALALFLGNVIDYSRGEKTLGHKRKGYAGYLLSAGNFHIIENQIVPDNWLEAEAKFKGDLATPRRKMSFSFRVGTKAHFHRDIADTVYIGLRRDRIDYEKTPLSFLLSSGLNYRVDFRKTDLKPLSHLVMLEKNWTVSRGGKSYTFSLGAGVQRLSREKYSGGLADMRSLPESRIILRPNVKF